MTEDIEEKKKKAKEILTKEWDLLKKSGLLCQIGCTAGPQIIERKKNNEGKMKPMYNMFKWNALMRGPKKTPYDGYMFKFEITYPENYPESAPTVTCKTNIYHMNISSSGDVCVTSIKEKKGWAKAGDISTVLLSIFVILGKPNKESPYRSDLAELYINDKKKYEENAREECKKYAFKLS